MSPVVVNGVVYIQDMQANVCALDLATGGLRWEYQVSTPELGGPGPDGVAVADGRVYGTTPRTVFALSAATGKPAWVDRNLLTKGQGIVEIQPRAIAGRLHLASRFTALARCGRRRRAHGRAGRARHVSRRACTRSPQAIRPLRRGPGTAASSLT